MVDNAASRRAAKQLSQIGPKSPKQKRTFNQGGEAGMCMPKRITQIMAQVRADIRAAKKPQPTVFLLPGPGW